MISCLIGGEKDGKIPFSFIIISFITFKIVAKLGAGTVRTDDRLYSARFFRKEISTDSFCQMAHFFAFAYA